MGWKEYGDWAFYTAAFMAVLFALLYLLLAPWWQTFTGRNIMALMGSLALGFSYFGFVIWSGGLPPGFYPMRAFIFTAIAVAIAWRVVIFVRRHILWLLRGERGNDELENARQGDSDRSGDSGDGYHSHLS